MEESKTRTFQLEIGTPLQGVVASYEIIGGLGFGAWGETYKARVCEVHSQSAGMALGTEVALKTPTFDVDRSFEDKLSRLPQTHGNLIREYLGRDRLQGLPCVASVVDVGLCFLPPLVPSGEKTPAMFVIQKFVPGSCLRQYVEEKRPDLLVSGEFRGIPRATLFLGWARMLACALLQVHQRQVVHADIWPENVMVDLSDPAEPYPVLIDFGLAAFRDLTAGRGRGAESPRGYLAPEGRGTVGSDIYALGGTLYYLAAGSHPPIELRDILDIDELKNRISSAINPSLLEDNCGIADVITRCLRPDPCDRIAHAEGVIQDIETFIYGGDTEGQDSDLPQWPCSRFRTTTHGTGSPTVMELPNTLERLRSDPLFHRMAELRTRRLLRDVEDMSKGVYDLVGDHEDIVSALSQYLSVLGKGDRYLTVSLPSWWRACNLGINGRFLSMNRLVVQKGAVVKRIFLVTPEEMQNDDEIEKIIEAHRNLMLAGKGKGGEEETGNGTAGYYGAFKVVSALERQGITADNRHFGLLTKGGKHTLLYPVYRADGVLTAIQFRTSISPKDLEEFFAVMLLSASPLTEYPFRRR